MAPRHPSTSASCDLGLRWHRAPWRQEGRHRGKPVPEGQAAARPGAAGLGPVAGSGWRRCWDAGRWRRRARLSGGVRAGGVRGYSAALQGFAFPTFGGAVAGSPGSRLVPLPGPDGRTSRGSAFPQRGRPASPYAGGLPGALPGLPVPHTRAGPGRPTARATRKRQRAPSEPVRAPPRP